MLRRDLLHALAMGAASSALAHFNRSTLIMDLNGDRASLLRSRRGHAMRASSEQRDILPRHLGAFGVELLQAVDRLGVSAKDAVLLIAVPEKTGAAAKRGTS